MYKKPKFEETSINVNDGYEGETIEQKVERILNKNEPITDGAPTIYQERGEGVEPAYDIRTDKFDIAVEAMSAIHDKNLLRREEALGKKEGKKDSKKDKKEGEEASGQSTHTTSGKDGETTSKSEN